MELVIAGDFDEWRSVARRLIADADHVPPEDVQWSEQRQELSLFEAAETVNHSALFRVPRDFMELAQIVGCHRDPVRWRLLYRVLWRSLHGEKHLLAITTDGDVYTLHRMQKSVTRDIHKMKAFVRFRKVASGAAASTPAAPDAQTEVFVCLGSTSAQALMGRDFRITQDRGNWIETDWCPRTMATWHPAAILRQPDSVRNSQMQQQFIDDLKAARQSLKPNISD